MAQVQSAHVIQSLRNQLSEAHLRIAMLEAEMAEMRPAQPNVTMVPAEGTETPGVD